VVLLAWPSRVAKKHRMSGCVPVSNAGKVPGEGREQALRREDERQGKAHSSPIFEADAVQVRFEPQRGRAAVAASLMIQQPDSMGGNYAG
jgi:hypothetical protein